MDDFDQNDPALVGQPDSTGFAVFVVVLAFLAGFLIATLFPLPAKLPTRPTPSSHRTTPAR